MKLKICLLALVLISSANAFLDLAVPDNKHVFDLDLYEDVLDSAQCLEQIRIVANNSMLLTQFLDAGPRTPKGILKGNLVDLGSYHDCLDIDEYVENTDIKGKYCSISIPLAQDINFPSFPEFEWPNVTLPENITWPEVPWSEMSLATSRLSKETMERIRKHNILRRQLQKLLGVANLENNGRSESAELADAAFSLAICIPRTCTSQEALSNLFQGFNDLNLQYTEQFSRLPNDKKWVAGDYTAIAIFSFIILLAIISTSYDIHQTVVVKRDPKSVNKLYQSFSVYTNTRRLLTFTPVPGALDCLDGVRALAMIWVIIGHTFANQLSGQMANPVDTLNWVTTVGALWITSGPITVDTFFMISGLLIVYTTAGKMTRMKFIKNVHLFYLNRLLRLFPVLAAVILLQVSVFNRVTDGPHWEQVATQTHNCRTHWWTTLLYIQNFYNPLNMCLPHSWYLAIDFQMFLLSPLFLFWVISGKRSTAWIALVSGLLVSLVGSTIFNFMMDLASAPITLSRPQDQSEYLQYYYVNTLTRCSPFFVGMIYGYLLHLYKGKKLVLSKVQAGILWILALAIILAVIYSTNPVMQPDWDNQLADNFINSFMRPTWALGVGWIVFACSKGYGGPINWVLCLGMWKLLGRLSYAMYIIHYPLMFVVSGTGISTVYFSVEFSFHRFATDFAIAVLSAFIVTLFVDSPCSTLIKMFMGGGSKRPPNKLPEVQMDNENSMKRNFNGVVSPDPGVINKTAL